MDCKVTCFERVMHLVKELPKDKYEEAIEIIQDCSFEDFLDLCIENNCFTKEQSSTLYDGIVMWEDLDGNYWEEDYDKLYELYDKVGITEDVLEQFTEDSNVNERQKIYDEMCRVLTEWETQEAVDDDLYWMLVKIQNNWETVITANTED
jgi:hypothetical protein